MDNKDKQTAPIGLDLKWGAVCKAAVTSADLSKINAQALKELTEEDVFTFRVAACNDQIDREGEQFTLACLKGLAKLYVGKTVVRDHSWCSSAQMARIYDARVESIDGANCLVLMAYMLRTEETAPVIAAIEGGILREVSVGCRTRKALCSICGTDRRQAWCAHRPGQEYDGKTCVIRLDDPTDAYEVSFCAVPAQPAAGVVKAYGGEENRPQTPDPKEDPKVRKALALLELEAKRFL